MRQGSIQRRRSAPSGLLAEARRLAHESSLQAAVECYASLLTSGSASAQVWLEYGLVLLGLEYYQRALGAFDTALAKNASLACAWNERGVTLAALRRDEEARIAFETAQKLDPQLASALSNLATWHLNHGDAEQAAQLFGRALAAKRSHLPARLGLGRALQQLGHEARAQAELAQALKENPYSWDALLALTVFRTSRCELVEARRGCREFLSRSPGHSGAIGLQAELGRELGDAEVSELLDSELWLRIYDLDVQPTFLSELAEHIVNHHSLTDSPPHHATQGGRHSGALFGSELPLLVEVENLIAKTVSAYYRGVTSDPRRAARLASPAAVALNSWSVVLDGPGCQLPHLHPAAWLSGVLYVAAPEMPSDGLEHRGCLQLGPVDPALGLTARQPARYVTPSPGRLVLFPSWLYHSTIPHRAPGLRVSLAFDCVRVEAARRG